MLLQESRGRSAAHRGENLRVTVVCDEHAHHMMPETGFEGNKLFVHCQELDIFNLSVQQTAAIRRIG